MDSILREKLIEEAGAKCELCGSRRGLDVHHIIPRVCGGPDLSENLIVACAGCHGKLTPKGLLTKYGQHKYDQLADLIDQFYEAIHAETEDGVKLTANDVIWIFEHEFLGNIRECKCNKRIGWPVLFDIKNGS